MPKTKEGGNLEPYQNVPHVRRGVDPRTRRLDKMWEMKRARPLSETEALMMAEPGRDPDSLLPTEHPLEDVIAEVLEAFTPEERELITLSVVGQMAVREVAAATGLSKTEVHRRLQKLMPRVAEAFKSNPEIMEYVYGTTD